MYSECGNYIKVLAMKDRNKQSFRIAYEEGLAYFNLKGLQPTFQRLDNEISNDFRAHLLKHNIILELVPPGQHRRNRAERAIRTFKNHFISILAGVDPSFPANLWSDLLPQAELTINLLRESTCNPRMSAWEELNGAFDFNSTPLAPPGMRITVHEKSTHRASWAKHGKTGFYIGPAFDTYRSYQVHVDGLGVRNSDTVEWHPHGFDVPVASSVEIMQDAARTFSEAVQQVVSDNTITAHFAQPAQLLADSIRTDLLSFASLFNITDKAASPASEQRVPACVVPPASEQRVPVCVGPPASEERVPACVGPPVEETRVPRSVCTPSAEQRVSPSVAPPVTEQRLPLVYHPGNKDVIPPGFAQEPTSEKELPQVTATNINSKKAKLRVSLARTITRPERYISAATIKLDEEKARAFMIANRFGGNTAGGRGRRREPTERKRRYSIAQAVHTMDKLADDNWADWIACDNVQLDSAGVPFFIANTAVDLDTKGRKLASSTAMKGPEADIWLHHHGI